MDTYQKVELNTDNIRELSDSDLLLLANKHNIVKLENFEVCFKGIRYSQIGEFPTKLLSSLREGIEEELKNQYLLKPAKYKSIKLKI